MAHETFEERMERACKDLEIAGAVMFAESNDGRFHYEKAFGARSLKDLSNPDPMPLDAAMWLASCTKFPTTIAAMQCVEKGLFTLDEDVGRIMPELKGMDVITGFETGKDGKEKAVLVKNTKPITLRQLLTHSSGLGYDVFNPVLMRYRATQGKTPSLSADKDKHIMESMIFPLLFEPGTAWEYSVGIDFAGWMVERVSGLTLEDYLNEHVWGRLGVTSMCFHPKAAGNEHILSKITDMSVREGGQTMFGTPANVNGKMGYTKQTVWNMETNGCAGGAGCYGPPQDYHKMLQSILKNDEKLLKKATVEEMFRPQLSEASRTSFMDHLKLPDINQSMGGWPMGTKLDWGIGGALVMEDLEGRKKGTMCWGGYPNLLWWVDRVGGMAGVWGSQSIYPGDAKVNELFWQWEKTMYERAEAQRPKL